MTGPIEPAGPSLRQDPAVASDRLSTDGQSITACRSLAAPVIPHVNAEAVHNHLDGQAKMAKTNH